MRKLITLIGASTLFLLSGCGGGNGIDTNKLNAVSAELNASATQFSAGASRVTRTFDNAFKKLDSTAEQVDKRAKNSQLMLDRNTAALNAQLEKFQNTFKEANANLAKLETLYLSEGTLELTGESGKLNLKRFPATAQTKCSFMEDAFFTSRRGNGRVQSDGIWTINGKEYDLKEKMTFNYEASFAYKNTSTNQTQLKSVTFTNTHGEIVTSSKISGYLLSSGLQQSVIKLEAKEANGIQTLYIPKGKACLLVLNAPLNLNIRQ